MKQPEHAENVEKLYRKRFGADSDEEEGDKDGNADGDGDGDDDEEEKENGEGEEEEEGEGDGEGGSEKEGHNGNRGDSEMDKEDFALARRGGIAKELFNAESEEEKQFWNNAVEKEYKIRCERYNKALSGEELYDPELLPT